MSFIEMKLYKQQVWDIKFYYKWWKQPLSTSQYRASQTNAPLISCKPSIFAQPPRALLTKLPNRWNIHLIKRSISSVCVCAHMIVRATTINLPFVHPCKLKGPKNARFRRKYNITNTFTAMNSCQKRFCLSKTLCSRKRRVTASQKRCGGSKLLYKRIFVMIWQANRPLSTANYWQSNLGFWETAHLPIP